MREICQEGFTGYSICTVKDEAGNIVDQIRIGTCSWFDGFNDTREIDALQLIEKIVLKDDRIRFYGVDIDEYTLRVYTQDLQKFICTFRVE